MNFLTLSPCPRFRQASSPRGVLPKSRIGTRRQLKRILALQVRACLATCVGRRDSIEPFGQHRPLGRRLLEWRVLDVCVKRWAFRFQGSALEIRSPTFGVPPLGGPDLLKQELQTPAHAIFAEAWGRGRPFRRGGIAAKALGLTSGGGHVILPMLAASRISSTYLWDDTLHGALT